MYKDLKCDQADRKPCMDLQAAEVLAGLEPSLVTVSACDFAL